MFRALYKRIKTKDGMKDFKHKPSSYRNSKKMRQRSRRRKMRLYIIKLKRSNDDID
jgi:hypothetical protein